MSDASNEPESTSDASRWEPSGASLGRRIAASLAVLVIIAGLLSAGILALHVRVTAALEATRADEAALELDPVRMQQVLANLLRNAADAGPESAAIELRGWLRERVFEPFFSERRGGSGLGLAVSRGIVEAHGGRIYVDPDYAEGARVTLELPRSS